jgi:molybdenum cofactor cytidylyltransferase
MTATEKNIGAIILAAGASSRLGTPKQLLPYAGKTLLQYTVKAALDSIARPVIVVLGFEAEKIKDNIDGAQVIVNPDWQEGMSSSIRCGIQALDRADPSAEGTIILVSDQPYITSALLNELVTEHRKTGEPIVASSYDNTLGVPALFHKSIFAMLLQLKGDAGAKSIIQQHSGDVGMVTFSKGGVDIDTKEDLNELSKGDPRS